MQSIRELFTNCVTPPRIQPDNRTDTLLVSQPIPHQVSAPASVSTEPITPPAWIRVKRIRLFSQALNSALDHPEDFGYYNFLINMEKKLGLEPHYSAGLYNGPSETNPINPFQKTGQKYFREQQNREGFRDTVYQRSTAYKFLLSEDKKLGSPLNQFLTNRHNLFYLTDTQPLSAESQKTRQISKDFLTPTEADSLKTFTQLVTNHCLRHIQQKNETLPLKDPVIYPTNSLNTNSYVISVNNFISHPTALKRFITKIRHPRAKAFLLRAIKSHLRQHRISEEDTYINQIIQTVFKEIVISYPYQTKNTSVACLIPLSATARHDNLIGEYSSYLSSIGSLRFDFIDTYAQTNSAPNLDQDYQLPPIDLDFKNTQSALTQIDQLQHTLEERFTRIENSYHISLSSVFQRLGNLCPHLQGENLATLLHLNIVICLIERIIKDEFYDFERFCYLFDILTNEINILYEITKPYTEENKNSICSKYFNLPEGAQINFTNGGMSSLNGTIAALEQYSKPLKILRLNDDGLYYEINKHTDYLPTAFYSTDLTASQSEFDCLITTLNQSPGIDTTSFNLTNIEKILRTLEQSLQSNFFPEHFTLIVDITAAISPFSNVTLLLSQCFELMKKYDQNFNISFVRSNIKLDSSGTDTTQIGTCITYGTQDYKEKLQLATQSTSDLSNPEAQKLLSFLDTDSLAPYQKALCNFQRLMIEKVPDSPILIKGNDLETPYIYLKCNRKTLNIKLFLIQILESCGINLKNRDSFGYNLHSLLEIEDNYRIGGGINSEIQELMAAIIQEFINNQEKWQEFHEAGITALGPPSNNLEFYNKLKDYLQKSIQRCTSQNSAKHKAYLLEKLAELQALEKMYSHLSEAELTQYNNFINDTIPFSELPESLRNDPILIWYAIKRDPNNFNFLPPAYTINRELSLLAGELKSSQDPFFIEEYLSDFKDILIDILKSKLKSQIVTITPTELEEEEEEGEVN